MDDFFNMNGYGGFIWTAYSISAVVLFVVGFSIWGRSKSLAEKLKREASQENDKA